jgi:ubiquinone/menaquinone biosynthesis C-methylase UbiE
MSRAGRAERRGAVVWMGDEPDVGAWVNADQAAGEFRVRYAELFDAEARLHEQRLHAAANVGAAEHVLDIGCGTGRSTRAAGRAAAAGTVLGVDISAPVLELARRLTDREGLRNVSYRLADAQVDGLGPARYDVCISCFGVMFFADPVAAFTNIGRALRPGARMALLAWQAPERNEWYREIDQAIGGASARGARMFSLADQHTTAGILNAAGFTDVAFADVREPVCYGADSAQAYEFVTGLQATKDMLASLGPAAAEDALHGLRVTLAGHTTHDGVLFGARTWIITAQTPRRPRDRAPDIEDPGRIGHERANLRPPPDAE